MIHNARETMPEGKNVGSVAAMCLDCFGFASLAMVCLDEIWPGLCGSLGLLLFCVSIDELREHISCFPCDTAIYSLKSYGDGHT